MRTLETIKTWEKGITLSLFLGLNYAKNIKQKNIYIVNIYNLYLFMNMYNRKIFYSDAKNQ